MKIRKNYNLQMLFVITFDSKSMSKVCKQSKSCYGYFIKYEFWPNLFNALKRKKYDDFSFRNFRKNQIFFKFYGGFMRKSFNAFHHFFVQDEILKIIKTIDLDTQLSVETHVLIECMKFYNKTIR